LLGYFLSLHGDKIQRTASGNRREPQGSHRPHQAAHGRAVDAKGLGRTRTLLLGTGHRRARRSSIKVEEGLGHFLRSPTGLDRTAAKEAVSAFVAGGQLTSDQLEFLDRIFEALAETGFVDPKNFYERPYTDIDSRGIVGVFPKEKAKQIINLLEDLTKSRRPEDELDPIVPRSWVSGASSVEIRLSGCGRVPKFCDVGVGVHCSSTEGCSSIDAHWVAQKVDWSLDKI
jgi:EcoEI R protein C-terminal